MIYNGAQSTRSDYTQVMTGRSHILSALEQLDDNDTERTPSQVAAMAQSRGALLDRSVRARALEVLTTTSTMAGTATGEALKRILENADRSADVLGLVGYMPLRHLRAAGITLSEMADDLGVNLHDLTEFMARQPTAREDAELDSEAFADRKASEMLRILESDKKLTKEQVELQKTRANFLLEYNKRLSHKWAQREAKNSERLPSLVINIGANPNESEPRQPVPYVVNNGPPTNGVGELDPDTIELPPLPGTFQGSVNGERDMDPIPDQSHIHNGQTSTDPDIPKAAVHWLVNPKLSDPTQDN